jgi:sugar lactone lactonase YvrE/uncharacterized membrane protein
MFLPANSCVVRLVSAFTRISPRPGRMRALRLAGAAAVAALLAGVPLAAQTVNVGFQFFGPVDLGNNLTKEVTVSFFGTGTLVSIKVLTDGAAGADFNDAGSGTCKVGANYHSLDSCTVDVSFTPHAAGSRFGDVLVRYSTDDQDFAGGVSGTGVAPQVTYSLTTGPISKAGRQSTLVGGFSSPAGVTADGNRRVSAADSNHSKQIEPNAIGTSLGSGFSYPWGVAVDGGGNVFVADNGNSAVKEIVASGGYTTVNTLGSGFSGPTAVAVDGGGNLIVADAGNNAVREILAAGGYTTVNNLGKEFSSPTGVAVDGSGNGFVTDENLFAPAVKEILAAGGFTTVNTLYSSGYPAGVAVDASGNVYFSDSQANFVGVIVAPGGYTTVNTLLFTSFNGPEGLALDGSGNVFVADTLHNAVVKLDYADPPSLSFATTSVGSTSSDSPRYVAITNDGNAPLVFTNISYPADFPEALGDSNACTSSTSLGAGESCDLPISFSPKAGGSLSEALVLTDNALNVSGSTQSITLKGSSPPEPTLTWATPAAITYGTALSAKQLDAKASVAGTFAYTPAAGTVLKAGSQTLSVTFTPTDTTNYSPASKSVTLLVNKAEPVLTWATPAAITYGTALSSTQLDASASVPGAYVYAPHVGRVLVAGAHILVVTFTPTDSTDYATKQVEVTLTVNKAALAVKANNESRAFGVANPMFTDSITGFVNGDGPSAVKGTASLTTTATTTSHVGTYPISTAQGTLAAANYTFTFISGTLTVNKAKPVVTWASPAPITYGTALSAKELNASASVPGTYVYAPHVGRVLVAGAHILVVTFTPTDSTDYTARQVEATLTVNKAVLKLTAKNASRAFGAPNPTFTDAVTGFVNGDGLSAVKGAASLTTKATATSPAGTYPIVAAKGTLSAANYSFTFVNGTLTVQ